MSADAYSKRTFNLPHQRRPLLLVGSIAMLSGCVIAQDGPTAVPVDPAPSVATAATPGGLVAANGTYDGLTQLVAGSIGSCGNQDMITLQVMNDRFSYTLNQPQVVWQPTRVFDVVIAPNGSFQATSGTASMRGTAAGRHIAGDIVGDACSFHFEADSSGSW
jgi:hypothetical protein